MNKLKKFVNFVNKVKGKLKIRKQHITIFFVALIVGGFYQVLKSDPSTRDAILAFATVIMAFAAFWAIQSANSREENRQKFELNKEDRDRKERFLNEIIEWGIDVAKPKYALNLISLTSSTVSVEDQVSAYQLGQASNTQILIERGKYIGQIALIFTQDLSIAVENVRHDLEEHDKLIHDWVDSKCISKTVGEHDYILDQAASKVIEEATKIKTRDVS